MLPSNCPYKTKFGQFKTIIISMFCFKKTNVIPSEYNQRRKAHEYKEHLLFWPSTGSAETKVCNPFAHSRQKEFIGAVQC
jgi:hypothetical protein